MWVIFAYVVHIWQMFYMFQSLPGLRLDDWTENKLYYLPYCHALCPVPFFVAQWMNKWIDMWVYDTENPVHSHIYFPNNEFKNNNHCNRGLPHCKCFLSPAHMHCPIHLNSCQLWWELFAQMGKILISFTVQTHPMFQWMCKLWNICVASNVWHLCPFGCMPQI